MTVSTDTTFEVKGEPKQIRTEAEADSNRGPSAYQPAALPLGQTGSHLFQVKSAELLPVNLAGLN